MCGPFFTQEIHIGERKHFLKQKRWKIDCTSRNLPDFMCAVPLFTLIHLLQQPDLPHSSPWNFSSPKHHGITWQRSISLTLPCKWSQCNLPDLTFCPHKQHNISAVVRLQHKGSLSAKVGSEASFPTWTLLLQVKKKESFVKGFHSYCLFGCHLNLQEATLIMKDFSWVFTQLGFYVLGKNLFQSSYMDL